MSEEQKYICEPQKDPRTKKHLLVCSLDIGRQGGKHVSEPAKLILKGEYLKERSMLHKILDGLGALVLIATITAVILLILPKHTPDFIIVDSTIAPKEVITGGSSTLTFRYENQSDETLENVRVEFDFPKHFKLDGFESQDAQIVEAQILEIGTINPTQYGFIHLKGTMFGDVGGEQLFTTTFTYSYESGEKTDAKIIEHSFSPTKSTLELNLQLPEHLVSRQQVSGSITYANTGDMDFPDLIIAPDWPATFELIESNVELKNDAFHITPIASGEIGEITFIGILGDENDSTFIFAPSFKFGDDTYTQEILVDTIDILPPPIATAHEIEESILIPGELATIHIHIENTSEFSVSNVIPRLSTSSGIFETSNLNEMTFADNFYLINEKVDQLNPGESYNTTVHIPVKSSLNCSALTSCERIKASIQSSATFDFEPTQGEKVESNTFGSTTDILLSSPIVLQSFGRYYMSSGDQLGRGPLPPLTNETTKYWIFWNISGTTNPLTNVSIEAPLGPGVNLTGKQSVSYGSAVQTKGDIVTWSIPRIEPTLPAQNPIIGIAFEVEITPNSSQVGTTPVLLQSPTVRASDEFTGGVITAAGSSVTTNLYQDSKAQQYGSQVEE
jgi:hypothetical protein